MVLMVVEVMMVVMMLCCWVPERTMKYRTFKKNTTGMLNWKNLSFPEGYYSTVL